jgi:hypothetical protein
VQVAALGREKQLRAQGVVARGPKPCFRVDAIDCQLRMVKSTSSVVTTTSKMVESGGQALNPRGLGFLNNSRSFLGSRLIWLENGQAHPISRRRNLEGALATTTQLPATRPGPRQGKHGPT